jgi:hypothetical protein
MATQRWTSRAIVRYIEAGNSAVCEECGAPVQFRARLKVQQVICNVYERGRWDRVEHFHRDCYDTAGQPFGTPDDSQLIRPKHRPSSAAAATASAAAVA